MDRSDRLTRVVTAPEAVGPPKPEALRDAIAGSLWAHVKAYDLGAVCEKLGLEQPETVRIRTGASRPT